MKAIGYIDSLPIADANSLLAFDLAVPQPGPRDLLVRVHAISVNPVDTKVRKRKAGTADAPVILGWDAAGVVEAVGSAVTLFKPGDAVYYAGALDRPGTNAEFHLVDERIVGRKPATLPFAEAAALPLTSVTAWELLFDRLGVVPGKRPDAGSLLIIGGAGGVGSILIQLARRLTGLRVIATASRAETVAWCRQLGAHEVVDHRGSIAEALKAIGVAQVDYVASLTATDQHFPAIVTVIKPQGRLALIDDPAGLDVGQLKRKSVSLHWEFMYTRSMFETDDMIAQHRILDELAGLIDDGLVRTTLGEHLGPITVENLKKAHARLESGTATGKLVLEGF